MKKLQLAIAALALSVSMAACNANPENSASSTPIDSTNLNGTAPATYGAENPAMPDSPKNQGASENGLRANNASSEDSAKGRH